jgi:hypothetical protein
MAGMMESMGPALGEIMSGAMDIMGEYVMPVMMPMMHQLMP